MHKHVKYQVARARFSCSKVMINFKVCNYYLVIFKSGPKVKVNVIHFGMFQKVFPQGIHMNNIKLLGFKGFLSYMGVVAILVM